MQNHQPSKGIKITIIGPTYPLRGGIAHYTTLLARELSRNHDVLLISFKRQYPEFLFKGKSNYDPSEKPIKYHHVEFIIDSLNPLTWEVAVQQIKTFRPDMVLFQWWVAFWAPQFYYIASRLRTKSSAPEIVFICHNVIEHEPNPIKRILTKHVFSQVDRFVTHCREETKRLKKMLFHEVKVVTAFHPTYRDYCTDAPSKAQAKKHMGLSGDVLLFFGFVRKYKGLNILLEAVSYVLKAKAVKLLVVGEIWEDKRTYLETIERLDLKEAVLLVDEYVSNEAAGLYFAAADLVVQPYLRASGSGVAQLAYGFDRPVIATDVGSLSEVIEDRGNGRIVAPNDAQALAAAILESLEPKVLENLSQQCKQTKEKYSWAEMADIISASGRGGDSEQGAIPETSLGKHTL